MTNFKGYMERELLSKLIILAEQSEMKKNATWLFCKIMCLKLVFPAYPVREQPFDSEVMSGSLC